MDWWACDSLEQALLELGGRVRVVSHDRYFLNRVVDLLLVLEGDETVQVVHGNYDTYELMRAQQTASGVASAKPQADAKPQAAVRQAKRKRRFPYRKI